MSYTNTINATRTPQHHITGTVETTNAQGTITEQTLKKVANFIGMDNVHEIQYSPTTVGYLSTDLELEIASRRSAFKETAALETAELQHRMDVDTSAASKAGALKTAEQIKAWFDSGRVLRQSRDLIETRAFFKHMHQEMNEIERFERDNRLADNIGETLRRSLAAKQTSLIKAGITSKPQLKHFTVSKLEPIKQTISRATGLATGAAGSVWGSVFQIGQLAARAAQFLGGRAAAKAEVIEREVPEALGEAGKAIAQLGKPASELVQDTRELFDGIFAPSTLSWAQLDALESKERAFRTGELNGDEVGQLHRFMLASMTSSLIQARNENRTLVGKFYVTELLEEMERERRIAQNKTNPTARLNAKRAAGLIMSHRRQVLCKQSAQAKAQEVRAASPQPTRKIEFALPTSAPHPKRAVPQVASKRYNFAREKSNENVLAAPKAAM